MCHKIWTQCDVVGLFLVQLFYKNVVKSYPLEVRDITPVIENTFFRIVFFAFCGVDNDNGSSAVRCKGV